MSKKPQPPVVDEWGDTREAPEWEWERPNRSAESSTSEAYLREIRDELQQLKKGSRKELPKTLGDKIFSWIGNLFLMALALGGLAFLIRTIFAGYTWKQIICTFFALLIIGLFAPPLYRRW
jgi:hypothetical protein